mgnify:CR=1 FL=1
MNDFYDFATLLIDREKIEKVIQRKAAIIQKAFEDCDVVIHLAAAVGVKITEEDPILTLNTNILGTKNVLEACKSNNVKKIILASSSEVYGEPLKIPIEESDSKNPINPLIGAAGVSAVPMAARVANKVGLQANPHNFLLMHAMGPNVAGVLGSAVAAGILLALVG